MHLLIHKSQRDDGWFSSSIVFCLDIRLDLSSEEHDCFGRYALRDRVIYASQDYLDHLAAAEKYREEAAEPFAKTNRNTTIGEHFELAIQDTLRITFNRLAPWRIISSAKPRSS